MFSSGFDTLRATELREVLTKTAGPTVPVARAPRAVEGAEVACSRGHGAHLNCSLSRNYLLQEIRPGNALADFWYHDATVDRCEQLVDTTSSDGQTARSVAIHRLTPTHPRRNATCNVLSSRAVGIAARLCCVSTKPITPIPIPSNVFGARLFLGLRRPLSSRYDCVS